MMPQDDFLKQFNQPPPDDFADDLLAQLKQLEHDAVGRAMDNASTPSRSAHPAVMLIPSPRPRRRTVDRYLTMIASIVMLVMVSSVLIVTVGNHTETINPSDALAPVATSGLAQLAWTPDGNALYVVDAQHLYRMDSRLQLISTTPLDLDGSVTSLAFIRDGAMLIIGDSSGTVTMIETASHTLIYSENFHTAPVQILHYVKRYNRLLSAGRDGDLVVLDVRVNVLFELDRMSVSDDAIPMYISGLSVHPDGNTIIATMNNSATFMYHLAGNGRLDDTHEDFAGGSLPPTLQTHYRTAGNNIVYTWWDSLVVLDSYTQGERLRYTLPHQYQWLRPLQLSDDELRVLLTNDRNQIGIWDFSREQYIPILDISRSPNHHMHSAMHPDGRLVAAILPDNEVHLWQISVLPDGNMNVVEIAVNRPGINRQSDPDYTLSLDTISLNRAGDMVELFNFGDGFLTQTLWSPDGNRLIVTSTGTVRVYDRLLQLQREWSLIGTDAVQTSLSNDGRFLVTGSSTGAITLWDAITGRIIMTMQDVHDAPVSVLTFLDSRNHILSRAENGEFALLRFDGSNLTLLDRNLSAALASYLVRDWHINGNQLRLVMMRDNEQNFTTGDLVNIIDFDLGSDFEAQTTTTAISGTFSTFFDNGQQLLVYQNNQQQISLHDSTTFEQLATIAAPPELDSVVHIQRDRINDQILLVDYDYELYRYDVVRGEIHHIEASSTLFSQPDHTVAIHPDGEHVAIIRSHNHIVSGVIEPDNTGYTLREIASDTPVIGQIQTFIAGPNNVAAASTSDGAVLLFDMLTGALLRRIELATWGIKNHDLAFDPTGQTLVLLGQPIVGLDSTVNIIDVNAAINGEQQLHRGESPYHFSREYVTGLAFNNTGQQLITGGSQVRLWTLYREEIRYRDADDLSGLMIFAYHPAQPEVATLRPGNYLRVFTVDEMRYRYSSDVRNRSGLSGTYLGYLVDGESLVLAAHGDDPELYDAATGNVITTLAGLPAQTFDDIVLDSSGRFLFAAGDYGVVAWDMQQVFSGQTDAMLLPVDFAVRQIAISHDSTRLFLVGSDGTVHVMGIGQN